MYLSLDAVREHPTLGLYRLWLYRHHDGDPGAVALVRRASAAAAGLPFSAAQWPSVARDILDGHRLDGASTLFFERVAAGPDGRERVAEPSFDGPRCLNPPSLARHDASVIPLLTGCPLPPLAP